MSVANDRGCLQERMQEVDARGGQRGGGWGGGGGGGGGVQEGL